MQEPDSLRLTSDTQPIIVRSLGTVRIDIGFDIHALVGTGQHQIAAGVDNTAAAEYYFGELNDNAGVTDVSVVSYDATNGYVQLDPQMPPSFHTGSGLFRLDAVAAAPQMHHLVTGWAGELYTSDAATAAYSGGSDIRFAFNGLDIDVRYVALIATQ